MRTTVPAPAKRSEEHTSELQSRYVISYAVFCFKKKIRQRGRSARLALAGGRITPAAPPGGAAGAGRLHRRRGGGGSGAGVFLFSSRPAAGHLHTVAPSFPTRRSSD